MLILREDARYFYKTSIDFKIDLTFFKSADLLTIHNAFSGEVMPCAHLIYLFDLYDGVLMAVARIMGAQHG